MDAASVESTQADLVAWGVLEAPGGPLTRRARAALARAASTLREEELAGQARPGHPLVLAAALALDGLAPAGAATARHHQVLAAVELASLPEGVQGMFGPGDGA
jgi:hypothetical protein